MKVSVIIPAWNGRDFLPDCLDAVLGQEYPDFEIIVVDNASTDGSAELVTSQYPQVHLIRNRTNLGFSGGCNVGIEIAQGQILAILNQDTQVQPGWLNALTEALLSPQVGVVGCKILYPDTVTIQHAGGWIEWPLGLAHHYGQGEQDCGQWDEAKQVEYVTGAAIAFRRDAFEKIGGLDTGFWPGYFEDVDFCFRAREQGFGVWYIPKAVAIHWETTSLTDPVKRSCTYQKGRIRFVLKHLPPSRFLTDFVPGEKDNIPLAIRGQEQGECLQLAYLEGILTAAPLLRHRWQADKRVIQDVLLALQELHEQALIESRAMGHGVIATHSHQPADMPLVVTTLPPLHEYQFHSSVPVFGPLISKLRSLWYNVAARWAIQDLIRQQEIINQQQRAFCQQQTDALMKQAELLEQRVTLLSEINVLLAHHISDLILQIYPEANQR